MAEYLYTSTNKYAYSQQPTLLPSAQKSQERNGTDRYFDHTPDRNLTFSAKKGNRLSSARRSLEECIQMVAEKRQMNLEAFDQVKHVNQEVLGSIASPSYPKANLYEARNKTTEQYRKESSRDNTAISQFQWNPYTPPRMYQSEYRPAPTFYDNNQQNNEVRLRLSTEVKKNNDLMMRVRQLQNQVSSLRGASNYHAQQGGNFQEVLQQNRALRNQLALCQLGSNYNLVEELQRLKAENNELRKDTISLLKNRSY